MEILLYVLGSVLLIAGIAGLVLPVLPGALLILGGAVLVAWAERFTRVGWGTLVVIGLICAAIWAVDVLAAVLGAKAFGASGWAILGASLGLLALINPMVGWIWGATGLMALGGMLTLVPQRRPAAGAAAEVR